MAFTSFVRMHTDAHVPIMHSTGNCKCLSIFGGKIGVNWFFSVQIILWTPFKSKEGRKYLLFFWHLKHNLWVWSFGWLFSAWLFHPTHHIDLGTLIRNQNNKSSYTWHRQRDCAHLLPNQISISIFIRYAPILWYIYLYLYSTMKTD